MHGFTPTTPARTPKGRQRTGIVPLSGDFWRAAPGWWDEDARLLTDLQYVSRALITDKLSSYGVAKREFLPDVEHWQSGYLNNRAETSHRPPGVGSDRCGGSSRHRKPGLPLARDSSAPS